MSLRQVIASVTSLITQPVYIALSNTYFINSLGGNTLKGVA